MPASHTVVSNSHTAFTAQVQCHVLHEFSQAPNNSNLCTCHILRWVFGKYVFTLYPWKWVCAYDQKKVPGLFWGPP